MSLNIISTHYKNIKIPLNNVTTINDIKQEIFNELNIKIHNQRLFFDNKQLQNDKLISDYKLNEKSLVALFCRNKGS